jgi:hypothetical protein
MAQSWNLTYEGLSGKRDGAFHLHLREDGTAFDDCLRIVPGAAGGPPATVVRGALSVTGYGRIEDLGRDVARPAVPALRVRGTLAEAVDYEVRVDRDNPKLVRGQFEGSDLRRDFRAGDAIVLNGHVDVVERVEQDGEAAGKRLYLRAGVPADKMPAAGVTPQRDSDLVVVQNGAGEATLVVDRSGQVTAAAFAGALEARYLQGTLALECLPALPIGKISGLQAALDSKLNTGAQQRLDVRGQAFVQQLIIADQDGKAYPDNWIGMANNVAGTTRWLHIGGMTDGEGAARKRRLALWADIISASGDVGIGRPDPTSALHVAVDKSVRFELGRAQKLSLGGNGAFEVDAPDVVGGRFVVTQNGNVGIGIADPGADKLKVQGNASIAGTLQVTGTVTAPAFAGTVNAANLTGTLDVGRLPNLDAAKIASGSLHADRIPALPVARITGLQAALDSKLNTSGGTIAGTLTLKPTAGQAILSLQGGGAGSGVLDLRYKYEASKHRIGFTDGNGNWMTWSEFGSNDLYVGGRVYAQGGLVFYWGPDRAWRGLDNRSGGILGGSLAGTHNEGAPSDIRFKTALRPLRNALEKVMHLQGTVYRWGEPGLTYFTRDITNLFSAGPHATEEENQRLWAAKRQEIHDALAGEKIGLVAQEVEKIVPEVIVEDDEGYKHIQYQQLTALLVEAIKEQNELIRDLSAKVATLEAVKS